MGRLAPRLTFILAERLKIITGLSRVVGGKSNEAAVRSIEEETLPSAQAPRVRRLNRDDENQGNPHASRWRQAHFHAPHREVISAYGLLFLPHKLPLVNYWYRAYGLTISSNTSVPGLEQERVAADPPDFTFESGPEPPWVSEARTLPGRLYHLEPEAPETADPAFTVTERGISQFFELNYTDGTRFVVDGATRRLWGTYVSPLSSEDLATYFLGPVMGFLLRRRGITSLHASAVVISNCAILFSGDAETGKSTTAAALALRGVPVLCEDIAPLREEAGVFHVEPGYPRVCLWPDSVQNLLGAPDALPRLTPMWEKCYLALDGVQAKFERQRQVLGIVYLFAARSAEDNAPRIVALSPREALLELVQNTYMNWLLSRSQRAAEFDVLTRLVSRVPVRRIIPHSDPARISGLCDCILRDALSLISEKRPFAIEPGL